MPKRTHLSLPNPTPHPLRYRLTKSNPPTILSQLPRNLLSGTIAPNRVKEIKFASGSDAGTGLLYITMTGRRARKSIHSPTDRHSEGQGEVAQNSISAPDGNSNTHEPSPHGMINTGNGPNLHSSALSNHDLSISVNSSSSTSTNSLIDSSPMSPQYIYWKGVVKMQNGLIVKEKWKKYLAADQSFDTISGNGTSTGPSRLLIDGNSDHKSNGSAINDNDSMNDFGGVSPPDSPPGAALSPTQLNSDSAQLDTDSLVQHQVSSGVDSPPPSQKQLTSILKKTPLRNTKRRVSFDLDVQHRKKEKQLKKKVDLLHSEKPEIVICEDETTYSGFSVRKIQIFVSCIIVGMIGALILHGLISGVPDSSAFAPMMRILAVLLPYFIGVGSTLFACYLSKHHKKRRMKVE